MLYDRVIKQGTINEPDGKPQPHFALPSAVNWMRALRLLIEDEGINFANAEASYARQARRSMDARVENTVLEQLFLALHHLSALVQFQSGTNQSDYARIGILAWYYGITNAASAMTAAQAGSFQEDHAGTARLWDTEIAKRGLAMGPFGWRVSTLVEKLYKPEVASYRGNSNGKLLKKPATKADALGAAAEYLSGSAKWYAWPVTEDLRRTKEFNTLGVTDFRTKKAQQLRDNRLAKKCIGFLHQASRYRGKANYREALFLAYGSTTETKLIDFGDDLVVVLQIERFRSMLRAFGNDAASSA